MKTIKEYLLDKKCVTPQTVYLPKGAEIVAINDSNTEFNLVAIINPMEATTELHTFKVCLPGENLYVDTVKYIGSFKGSFGLEYIVELL